MTENALMNPSLFTCAGDRLIWRWNQQTLWVEPWGPDCIRVRATVLPEMPERDWSLLPARPAAPKIPLKKAAPGWPTGG